MGWILSSLYNPTDPTFPCPIVSCSSLEPLSHEPEPEVPPPPRNSSTCASLTNAVQATAPEPLPPWKPPSSFSPAKRNSHGNFAPATYHHLRSQSQQPQQRKRNTRSAPPPSSHRTTARHCSSIFRVAHHAPATSNTGTTTRWTRTAATATTAVDAHSSGGGRAQQRWRQLRWTGTAAR